MPRESLTHTLGAALLSLGLGGCQEQPPGAELEATERPFTVTILDTQACPLPEGVDAQAKRILGIKVRLRSHHRGRVPANYFYASLLTTGGARYLAELVGCTPLLSDAPLGPGETAEGYPNFPLPIDATPARLVYAPKLDGTRGFDAIPPRFLSEELPLR